MGKINIYLLIIRWNEDINQSNPEISIINENVKLMNYDLRRQISGPDSTFGHVQKFKFTFVFKEKHILLFLPTRVDTFWYKKKIGWNKLEKEKILKN